MSPSVLANTISHVTRLVHLLHSYKSEIRGSTLQVVACWSSIARYDIFFHCPRQQFVINRRKYRNESWGVYNPHNGQAIIPITTWSVWRVTAPQHRQQQWRREWRRTKRSHLLYHHRGPARKYEWVTDVTAAYKTGTYSDVHSKQTCHEGQRQENSRNSWVRLHHRVHTVAYSRYFDRYSERTSQFEGT